MFSKEAFQRQNNTIGYVSSVRSQLTADTTPFTSFVVVVVFKQSTWDQHTCLNHLQGYISTKADDRSHKIMTITRNPLRFLNAFRWLRWHCCHKQKVLNIQLNAESFQEARRLLPFSLDFIARSQVSQAICPGRAIQPIFSHCEQVNGEPDLSSLLSSRLPVFLGDSSSCKSI